MKLTESVEFVVCGVAAPIPMTPTSSAEMERVYEYVRADNKKKEMKILNKDCIELQNPLGSGQFGSVYQGVYKYQVNRRTMKEVPVAVKVLKNSSESPTAEVRH